MFSLIYTFCWFIYILTILTVYRYFEIKSHQFRILPQWMGLSILNNKAIEHLLSYNLIRWKWFNLISMNLFFFFYSVYSWWLRLEFNKVNFSYVAQAHTHWHTVFIAFGVFFILHLLSISRFKPNVLKLVFEQKGQTIQAYTHAHQIQKYVFRIKKIIL